jgi:hypothetical protein
MKESLANDLSGLDSRLRAEFVIELQVISDLLSQTLNVGPKIIRRTLEYITIVS